MLDHNADRLQQLEREVEVLWEASRLRETRAEARFEAQEEGWRTLLSCLGDYGIVDERHFEVKFHKRRFAKMLARHPIGIGDTFASVAHLEGCMAMVAQAAGVKVAARLGAAAHAFRACGLVRLATVYPARICVVGGQDEKRQVLASAECLNTETKEWSPLPPMATARWGAAAAASKGMLYVLGGRGLTGQSLASVECLDIEKGVWAPLPEMGTPRQAAAAAVTSRGLLCVMGGLGDESESLDTVEQYYPHQGSWSPLPAMNSRRSWAAAACVDGCFYVFGGFDENSEPATSMEKYDPTAATWSMLPLVGMRRWGSAVAFSGRRLYVFGGLDASSESSASAECLYPDDSEVGRSSIFSQLPPMGGPRMAAAVAAAGGRLYVFGGLGAADARLGSVERFDPVSSSWASLPPMSTSRSWPAAATL
eukprot:gnl/TRDRNA2_/TRDRNA2_161874_c0_seq3.p1 gnl/TRDRNA2_/TRDRNA2_161874_c0~~gnl/TRDRNA2_/TRDRNA2_161874_c0_seq3.p1  ORF type:complete len:423 (+),score=64.90 gnl/TRDRNA2_/TRDRNA2_161874_c0_seq3:62-1330(+)